MSVQPEVDPGPLCTLDIVLICPPSLSCLAYHGPDSNGSGSKSAEHGLDLRGRAEGEEDMCVWSGELRLKVVVGEKGEK